MASLYAKLENKNRSGVGVMMDGALTPNGPHTKFESRTDIAECRMRRRRGRCGEIAQRLPVLQLQKDTRKERCTMMIDESRRSNEGALHVHVSRIIFILPFNLASNKSPPSSFIFCFPATMDMTLFTRCLTFL